MIPHALIFLIMKAQWLIDCLVSHRMFRNTSWRKTASDAVSLRQDQALSTTVFLLKSYGPTGFLLQEEGATRNHKVNHLLQVVCCWYSQKKKDFFLSKCIPTCSLVHVVQVCLGDPHTCTCPVFTKEREPCQHICWYQWNMLCCYSQRSTRGPFFNFNVHICAASDL